MSKDKVLKQVSKLGSNLSGRFGEWLTRIHLESRGYEILGENVRIALPDGREFRPDFLAYDPVSERAIAVDSKFGQGAKLSPNQLEGYSRIFKDEDVDILDRRVAKSLERATGSLRLDDVEIYRWKDMEPSSAIVKDTIARILATDVSAKGGLRI